MIRMGGKMKMKARGENRKERQEWKGMIKMEENGKSAKE